MRIVVVNKKKSIKRHNNEILFIIITINYTGKSVFVKVNGNATFVFIIDSYLAHCSRLFIYLFKFCVELYGLGKLIICLLHK